MRTDSLSLPSHLAQWSVQLKLAPVNAPYFEGAGLLIAADCAAYACGDFHPRFMAGRITLIGCPKLDEGDYSEKLTAILRENKVCGATVYGWRSPAAAVSNGPWKRLCGTVESTSPNWW